MRFEDNLRISGIERIALQWPSGKSLRNPFSVSFRHPFFFIIFLVKLKSLKVKRRQTVAFSRFFSTKEVSQFFSSN